jgi:Viral BACON domain
LTKIGLSKVELLPRLDSGRVSICALLLAVILAGLFLFSSPASAQTNDLTVDVLINSTNTTGYNTSSTSPGEYQRYPERYLENLQIPYRVIDVSNTAPPNLSTVPLIIAAHQGLHLSAAWQQAIQAAVQAGTGFVNLDWDSAIGTNAHMQAIFGCTSSRAGTAGASITLPATFLPDGHSPHYITGLQMRWPIGNPASASGDLVYFFHQDDSGGQGTATSTVLVNAQGAPAPGGTVLATIGSDAFWTVTTYGAGHAVNIGTYDYLRADRFGFVMGLDDLFWRSLVWAARKPFALRGYPRLFAIQQDDPVAGYAERVGDMFNPTFTGNSTSQTLIDGSKITVGGPWKVTGNIQTADSDFNNGSAERQTIINFTSGPYMKVGPHTNSGGSGGDLYWTGDNAAPLTDSQWLANFNSLKVFQQGGGPTGSANGTSDVLTFTSHLIPHFWDISNNVGYDMWQLGVRYVTEIQQPGVYYSGPPKTPSQRMPGLHPFRVYEQPPTNGNPNEIWSFFWADNYTIGSRAGLPAKTFFGFATQLQGMAYPSFDAKWPESANGIPLSTALENWQAYIWRFWSSMDPVQVYNHDGGSMADGTDQERQQFITSLSPWLTNLGSQNVFMEDMGAYLHARVNSNLTSGTVTPSTISLTFSGNATDMNGAPVTTQAYIFFGNDNGELISVPGFTSGTTVSVANVTPPSIGLSVNSLSFAAAPGGSNPPSQSISVSNTGSGTLTWTASESASWLSLTPSRGTNSGTITASVNSSGLAQGAYSTTIVVSAPSASNSPINVPVTLSVAPPTLVVSPTSLSFTGFQGQGNPASQALSVSNAGAGTVNWTATSSASWLTVSPASGTAPSTITASINTSGLSFGVYNANITVTSTGSSGSPQTIPVTFTLQGILLSDNFSGGTLDGLAVSPLGLVQNWSVTPGALQYNGAGPTQLYAGNSSWTDYNFQTTFQLSSLLDYPGGVRGRINPGTGAGYAVWFYPNEKTVKLFRNVAWNIDSGVTLLGQAAVSFDTAFHNVNLVFQGTQIQVLYDGKQLISVTDATYASGLVAIDVSSRPITFTNLLVTGTSAVASSLNSSANSMSFSGLFQGPIPASQTLNLSASSGSLSWTASSNVGWLSVSPRSGTTGASATVTANTQGLAGGSYNGRILLTALGATNVSQSIPVSLSVTLPPPTLGLSASAMNFTAISGQAGPAAQTLTISNLGSGTISWTATTDAPWLTVTSAGGSTPASTNVGINTTGLALGTFVGHVTITAAGVANSPQVLTVNLESLAQDLNENFSAAAQGWMISPLGHANGWSAAGDIYTYAGLGASESCAGNGNWGDYTFDTGIRFSSLLNYPGGVRARVNPSTGAGYALWFYPGSGLVKLFSVGQWNIDSGATLLAQAALSFDTTKFHDARMVFQGSTISVYWDGIPVISVTDSTYTSGIVCLDGSGQPVSYNSVQVEANQPPVTMAAAPASLTFAASGTTNPPSQTINVTSGGAPTVWAVTSNAAWLNGAASTTVTPGTITVSVFVSGLATGTYNGTLSVYAPGSTNSPMNIPVTLSVQSGLLAVAPNALTFFGATTLNPAGQTVNITNSGAGTLNWSGTTDSSWLSLTSSSGTAPSATTVNVNSASLATGQYSGNVIVTSPQAANSPLSIPATLQVGTLLFNDNFSAGAGNWTVSPVGSPANWSVASNAYGYNGAGTSNSSAGSQAWLNYDYAVDFKLASLNDYPGGIRGRVNLTTGSGYGAWIYPNEKVIKLFKIGQWNIDSGFTLLATSATINIDATNWHNLRLDFRGSTINVYFDNVLVIQSSDTTYTAGAVALDVSSQPIQFTNVVVIGF